MGDPPGPGPHPPTWGGGVGKGKFSTRSTPNDFITNTTPSSSVLSTCGYEQREVGSGVTRRCDPQRLHHQHHTLQQCVEHLRV